jgi:hypothetical protein
MMRRRRVGRPIVRTAVVVGTATAVSGAMAHHQQQKWEAQAAQQQAPVQPQQTVADVAQPASATKDDTIAQLERLMQLKQSGALTEEEFAAQKTKVLEG